jgi:hypothetical protein
MNNLQGNQPVIKLLGLMTGSGTWPRFSKYTVIEKFQQQGTRQRAIRAGERIVWYENYPEFFITPSADAVFRDWYRPFDHSSAVLRDFLDMLSSLKKRRWAYEVLETSTEWQCLPDDEVISRYRKEKMLQASRIVEFCKKWGMFGIRGHSWTKRETYNMPDDPADSWATPLMSLEDGPLRFGERAKVPGRQNDKGNPTLEPYYDELYSEIVSDIRQSAEGAHALDDFFDWMWGKAQDWSEYHNIKLKGDPPHPSSETSASHLGGLYADGVGIRLNYDNGWKMDYSFDSLTAALGIMFAMNQVSEKQHIKLCDRPGCHEVFIAHNPKARYHNANCGNLARVHRSRKKALAPKTVVKTVGELPARGRKASAQKTVAISAQKTVVKTVGELSTKQGKTGEKPRKRKTL